MDKSELIRLIREDEDVRAAIKGVSALDIKSLVADHIKKDILPAVIREDPR